MDWGNLVTVGNQSALQWYSTITGKPVGGQSEPNVIEVPAQVSTLSVVMMLGIVVVGAMLIFRK